MRVLTSTAHGFLAAGTGADGSATQAVIWTTRDGVTWRRMTAGQLGLAGPGETVQNISYATSRGRDTVISGTVAQGGTTYSGAWLSTNGGFNVVPRDGSRNLGIIGASTSITGLAFDGSGLIAVRPGRTADGTGDGVAYLSPNGTDLAVRGHHRRSRRLDPQLGEGQRLWLASSPGPALRDGSWPTPARAPVTPGSRRPRCGDAAGESIASATVGARETVVAVGFAAVGPTGQQPVFLLATTTGAVIPAGRRQRAGLGLARSRSRSVAPTATPRSGARRPDARGPWSPPCRWWLASPG